MQQAATTPMHSARRVAAEALRAYGIIDIANREQVLANGPDMAETLAALDRACGELSLAEIDWYRQTPDHADLRSHDLQQLYAATTAYLQMRKRAGGLAIDAAAGAMTSATFAQWLCLFAGIPRCGGCQAFVLGGAGHLCPTPVSDGVPSIGVGIQFDRARGVVILRSEHALDVELPIDTFLRRCGFRPQDLRPFAGQSAATSVIYKIRRRGQDGWSDGGAVPHWTRNGRTWNSPHSLKAHLREVVKHQLRQAGRYPVTDADMAQHVPADWEVVTIMTGEACVQDTAAFVAAHPTAIVA